MPTSNREMKDWALAKIQELNPSSVVDVGPGNGTYSDLARRYTDARWMAIEAWGPYAAKYNLWRKYDHVVISDIRHCDLNSIHPAPDLVVIGDVLEHMTHAEAKAVIARLQAWADYVLVCVPLLHLDQGPVAGNWFEIHRDHWSFEAMREALGDGVVDSAEGKVLGYFLWSCYA